MVVALLALAARAEPPSFAGRVELAPVTGWFFPAPKLALRSSFLYGVELEHFFLDTGPALIVGVYAKVQGSQTRVVDTRQRVDLIFGSAGVTIGPAGLGRWLPLLRLGEGFFLADGTPGGLEIQGRIAGEVALGVRYRASQVLALRAEIGSAVHDNLQLGAGSGELGDAWNLGVVAGVSVVR
jgi:hypothetical protein